MFKEHLSGANGVTLCSSVSIVNFEPVNVSWAVVPGNCAP